MNMHTKTQKHTAAVLTALALLSLTGTVCAAPGKDAAQKAPATKPDKVSAFTSTTLADGTPVTAALTVITAEEIHDNHYGSVAEALDYAPGVTVTAGSVNTSQQIVRINGDDRVAFFIDGRRQNLESGLPNGRATFDLDAAPPVNAIERIEIVPGYTTGNYMNYDAPGGTINIVTKKGREHKFQFEGARGPYKAWRWEATLEGSADGWSWFGTGGRDNIDALHYKSVGGDKETMPNSSVNRREMYYRFDRQFTPSQALTLTYGHFSNDRGLWLSRGWWDTSDHKYAYEKLANNLSLTYHYKDNQPLKGTVSLYHMYNQGDTYYPEGYEDQDTLPSYSRWKTKTNGIDWQDSWQVRKDTLVTAGATWRHTTVENEQNVLDGENFGKNYDEGVSNLSAYVTTQRRFGKLTMIGTSLLNHNTKFDNEYVYSGSLEYRPDDKLTLFGSVQRIYDTPTLDEMYYNNDSATLGRIHSIKGNPNLEPEEGFNWNGGLRYKVSENTDWSLSGFVSHINNPINWYYDRSDGRLTAKNFDSQNKQGLQLAFAHRFSPKYSMNASYAYTHLETDYGAGIDRFYTDEVAPHQFKAMAKYKDSRWTNSLLFTAGIGRDDNYFSGNYYVLDANVNYKFNKHWSSYVKLRNLLNESYETLGSREIGGVPAWGRTALFGFEYTY